jgi:hypothetical protein
MIEARSKRRDTASKDRKFEILAIEEARRSVDGAIALDYVRGCKNKKAVPVPQKARGALR